MKLILTQEVTGLGTPGDVVEVRDGYGRNYLVPRGFPVAWTKGGEKQVETTAQGPPSAEPGPRESSSGSRGRSRSAPRSRAPRFPGLPRQALTAASSARSRRRTSR